MYMKLYPRDLNPTLILPRTPHEFYICGVTITLMWRLVRVMF